MKILFDHDVFTYQQVGGIARCFSELMAEMEKREPGVCVPGFLFTNTGYLYDSGLAEKFSLARYPFRDSLLSKRIFFRINRFLFHEKLRQGDFDLLHLTFYPDPGLRKMTKKPIAVTIHDMVPELFPDLFPDGGKWISAKKFWCHNADVIFTVSDHTREDLLRIFPDVPERKIHRIYNAGGFPEGLHADLNLPGKFLLYVGGRRGYKNFLPMLSALLPVFREREELHLICAGGGGFTREEKELISGAGMENRVIQKVLTEAELAELYRHAEALIYPSLCEGFGIPILEAFSTGTPVLASDSSCFPEIAGKGALYFNPANPDSIADAVGRILSGPELKKELSEQGRARLRDFSWEKSAEEMLNVYRKYV